MTMVACDCGIYNSEFGDCLCDVGVVDERWSRTDDTAKCPGCSTADDMGRFCTCL